MIIDNKCIKKLIYLLETNVLECLLKVGWLKTITNGYRYRLNTLYIKKSFSDTKT